MQGRGGKGNLGVRPGRGRIVHTRRERNAAISGKQRETVDRPCVVAQPSRWLAIIEEDPHLGASVSRLKEGVDDGILHPVGGHRQREGFQRDPSTIRRPRDRLEVRQGADDRQDISKVEGA